MTSNTLEKVLSNRILDGKVEKSDGEIVHESFRRVYNVWTASAYQVLMMASWTCNIVLYGTVFDVGGPMMLIYSTIIVTIGQCFLMASLGEMCAVWPYSGGQQAYTKTLTPARARRFLSYMVGWVVYIGEIATSAGCAMNSAQIIASIVQLSYPTFNPTSWEIWLIYTAIILLSLLFCFSQKNLPAISLLGAIITLGGGIAWAVIFLVRAPKHDASFVFTQFINQSGYSSSGWVGLMSLYTPVYALYGTDGIMHITEEMHDPEKNAPKAMILSMVLSGVTSLMGAIVMAFCAGDWESYMNADLPFIPWFVEVLGGNPGAIAIIIIVLVFLNFLITVGINTAASRMAWGMARDNALPFSNVFVRISHKWDTPINTILLTVAAEMAIGLVVFGSNYAFQAIISLGGVAIQIGYLTPVLMLAIRGRSVLPSPHSFDLGRFGRIINVISACWSSLIIVILLFPLYVPVASSNIYDMNWAAVMCGGVILIVTFDWFLRARFQYFV